MDKKLIGLVILALVAWQIVGVVSLSMQQEAIKGGNGDIWNQIKTGGEKLGAIETQLKAAYADRQDLVDKIVEGRKAFDSATQSGNLDQATQAAQTLGSTLKVMVENYPQTDLSGLQVGTLDETAGIFNRIGYARGKQIDRQVGFNQSRILFMPVGLAFPRQSVLGEYADPMSDGPSSSFGK